MDVMSVRFPFVLACLSFMREEMNCIHFLGPVQRILPLVRRQQEPFAPASAQVLLWQVATTLRVALSRPPVAATTPASPASSTSQEMLTVWLYAVTSHALLPLCSAKVQYSSVSKEVLIM